jgi:hypothetical protein
MPADDVREFFERVDAEPSAQFTETLLGQLRAEYLRVAPDTNHDARRPTQNEEGIITVDVLHDESRLSRGRDPDRPSRRQNWRRNAVATVAAAALIVATIVLVRTATDDGGTVLTPAAPGPIGPSAPSALALPDGLKGLPAEGATPSTPATGQLVAPLPIPIWVYEDGRVISARWTTSEHWTGFLEQRLTPEGVELVRAEIRALEPFEGCGSGPPYWYGDGSRDVWEQPGGANMCPDRPQYERLSELQYGAASWLPASAWADPEAKPYVPSAYLFWINHPGPIDATAVLAALPTEAAELLTSPGPCPPSGAPTATPGPAHRTTGVCFQVTTEAAQHIAAAIGPSATPWDTSVDIGEIVVYAGYRLEFVPYLPHGDPVECCAG